jgi:hypothetical protein
MVQSDLMIAEFANYRSWIDWVPIVGLLAIPILFRRVLAVSLALVGAFVGFVVISLTMPLGSDAEQLGANVAAGLAGGAVVGALVGAGLSALRPRSQPQDASVIVVGCSMGAGVLGALVGGFGPSLLGGSPDLEVAVLALIAVGGGIGWALGAAIGWRLARSAPSPGPVQRWILAVSAVSIACSAPASLRRSRLERSVPRSTGCPARSATRCRSSPRSIASTWSWPCPLWRPSLRGESSRTPASVVTPRSHGPEP